MDITPFSLSDEQDVVHLWERCELIVPWNDPIKDIKRKLAESPELFLVGKLHGKIIATAMAGYDGHRGWINYLAVHPDYQRQEFGRQIVTEIEKLLLEKGCPKLNVQIRASNKDVIAFYKSLGFKDDHVIGLGKRLIVDEPL